MKIVWSVLVLFLVTNLASAQSAVDALNEVNQARSIRGLPPLIRDPNLTAGALNLAIHRAKFLIVGHTVNDFSGLPLWTTADAAGCAAWHPSWGWGSCATYESYRYAGAAWAMGRDGRRFMHLFVRR